MNDPFFGLNWIIKLTSYLSFPENGKKAANQAINTYIFVNSMIYS